ncbi:MAG: endonuclease/exonuclease/phosphatase family protein [Clostridia bacterium]|nr:endonuclease/exonuclease/phosphatase family protein [Clostridia bacterium]
MIAMTFNVLCAGVNENHWCKRQPLVRDVIKKYNPDVFGIQEAHYGWMRYISSQFRDTYAYVGVGKDDGGIKGEFSPVFYNKNKYELLDSGNFWLSETPDSPSLGWDGAENRTCAYALLKDKNSGENYAVLNTHLDHIGETAMTEGVKLVAEKANEFSGIKTIVTGDFNATPDTLIYKTMLSYGFDDARSIASEADNIDSIHWFGKGAKMIDFIFVKNGVIVNEVKTATDRFNGRYPSDHYPVVAYID